MDDEVRRLLEEIRVLANEDIGMIGGVNSSLEPAVDVANEIISEYFPDLELIEKGDL